MIDICESLGLSAVHDDSISFLAGLPDASIGGVTSFHMVEHLPFQQIIALVDHALRVLKPGGLLILETPNPQNILVGSHSFHLDPTHARPLPSELLWFLAEIRGFRNLRYLGLHPPTLDLGESATSDITARFCAPLDYAILGERP
jgi:O-antigen chain-terminating methyltransferase